MCKKLESLERINSIRETNGSFYSCNSCKRLGTSHLHELHESKFPFVSRIEFIRSKLSIFSAHVSWVSSTSAGGGAASTTVNRADTQDRRTQYQVLPTPPPPRPTAHRPGRYSSGRRTRCNIGEDRAVSVGSGGGYRSARRPRKSAGCYIGVRLGKGQLNWAIQSLAETQTVGSGVRLGEEAG